MHRLHRPAARDELAGKPVEQLRVRRGVALKAEIIRGADNPAAEVVLPQPVGHHAGSERVVGRGDPIGQHGAASARFAPGGGSGMAGVEPPSTSGNPGSTFGPGVRAAADQDERLGAPGPASVTARAVGTSDGKWLLRACAQLHVLLESLLAEDAALLADQVGQVGQQHDARGPARPPAVA